MSMPTIAEAEVSAMLLAAQSVVKVMANSTNSRVFMGSGVVVEKNKVATNCHVTGSAHSVAVFKGSIRYRVLNQSSIPELDVCILHTQNLPLPSVRLETESNTAIGDKVFLYGYPNAVGLSLRHGTIKQLHPFRDSQIIETNAGIVHGTSGGGLFNSTGRLIGLTTFMQNSKKGRFFAVPVDWVKNLLNKTGEPIAPFSIKPFWISEKFPNAPID